MKHDEFVRYVMADLALCSDFFRHFMGELENDLDFSRIKAEDGTFVSSSLRKLMTDLQFQVPWHKQDEVLVSILLEHKAAWSQRPGSASLPFQLRSQEMALLQRFAQRYPGRKLPVVLLVGLFHGPSPYSGPKTVAEFMEGPPNLIPERWKHQDMLLIDLNRLDESKLRTGKLSLFLRILKTIYDEDFIEKYRNMLPELRAFDQREEDREFLIALNFYLLSCARWESLPDFKEIAVKSYSDVVGGAVMTLADILKREGREQYLHQGIEKGIHQVVEKMIRKGLDWDEIAELSGLSHEKIALIANRAS